MKKVILLSFIILTAFIGYSQSPENYISNDSPIVISFKNKAMNEKIDEGMLNSLELYQNLSKETKDILSSYLKAVVLNDEKLGVSPNKDSYITFNFNDSVTIVQLILSLEDVEKFESTIQNYSKFEPTVSPYSTFKMLKKSYGNDIITYNNDVVILSDIDVKYSYLEKRTSEKFGYNSYDNTYSEEVLEEVTISTEETEVYEETPQRDYQAERLYKDSIKQIIQTEYLNSLFQNKSTPTHELLEFTQKSYDIGLYLDYASIYDTFLSEFYSNKGLMPSMANYSQLLQMMNSLYSDIKIFGELNFDNDQVSVKTSFKTDKETLSAMQKVLNAKVNKNMLKYIKADSLVFIMSMAVNVEAYADFYKDTFDKIVDSYTSKEAEVEMMKDAFDIFTTLFIDEEEVYDLLKGDMILTFNGVKSVEYEYSYQDYYTDSTIIQKRKSTQPVFSMMSTMGNKKVMDKVMNIVRKSDFFVEENGYFVTKKVIEREIGNLYLAYKNDILFFTNNPDLMQHINSGYAKSDQLTKTQQKKVLANSTYAFFDTDKLITSFSGIINDKEKSTADIFSNRLGLLEIFGSKIENGALTSTMTMDIEGEQNSLMNILLMIHEFYESNKQ